MITFRKSPFVVIITLCALLHSYMAVAQENEKYLDKPLPESWESDTLFIQKLPVEDQWWKELGDARLDSLIAQAVANNYNLLEAADRIRQARAVMRGQQAAYYPSVDFTAGWLRQQSSLNSSQMVIPGLSRITQYASADLSANWEIDLFGSIRNRVKSEKEMYKATREDYNGVMVSLCAEVASSYAQLRTWQQQYLVAQKHIASQQAILNITEVRYNTGLASQLDVAQAKSVYYSTKASLPALEASIEQQINAIAVLLGVYPEELRPVLRIPAPIPDYLRIVSIGIPANLLRQRPDIRAAERTVASNAASVGASRSDYLPKFYLKGSIGFAARDMDDFFNHKSLTYQIAPTLNWTLFQGTQRIQALQGAKAKLDESIRQYNQTVLTAVQEVDNAMTGYTNSLKQIVALREVVVQGETTLRLSLDLYKRGLTTFQNVLDALRSVLSYQNSLVSAQGGSLSYLIQLYRSVGGGWDNEQN